MEPRHSPADPVVYQDLGGPPNNWSKEAVDGNMFETYAQDLTQFTATDPASIMMYSFPSAWTLNGFGTEENRQLSTMDKAFIASVYKKPSPPPPPPVVPPPPPPVAPPVAPPFPPASAKRLVLDAPTSKDSIGAFGEEDLFFFDVVAAGRYSIVTAGSADMFMRLFGPSSMTTKIAEDDNGGYGLNARIIAHLSPGTYLVQVRHANTTVSKATYGMRLRKLSS